MIISILVFVLIACVVLWLVRAIVGTFPAVTAPMGNVIYAIVALLLLLVFLSEVGWAGPAHGWRTWR